MSGRTLVAMSGGVDSSVTAALLAEAGEDLVGVFMRNGVSAGAAARSRSCCSLSDARDARAVADRLGIPFYAHDLKPSFERLMDGFAADYAAGRTPNPCVVCNDDLKFGELLDLAGSLGCDGVATGHYARLEAGRLLRAADRDKDQSYLLAGLTADQRRRARFPLGAMTKSQVRSEAGRLGLGVAAKKDSADICFVPDGDYREVVRARRGDLGPAGDLVDETGRRLGEHTGVAGFTVGQRRGLGVALGRPSYVTAIDPVTGRVTLGPREALRRERCRVEGVVWHGAAEWGDVAVQLRHHHTPELARLVALEQGAVGGDAVEVRFSRPSEDVTPGQYAVFYRGELVLGSGRLAADVSVAAPVDTL